MVNSLASHLPIYSVKRTSIGKDKILSSRGNAEGPYSPWALSSSSLSQTETDSSSFCSVEDRGAGYSTESQRPPWYIRISRRIYHYYSLCRCVYIDVRRSNGIAKQYMRMNSLFDPDQTGTGHQPYYFDQFAALYNRYTVFYWEASMADYPQRHSRSRTHQVVSLELVQMMIP